jgi:hypothetical protein
MLVACAFGFAQKPKIPFAIEGNQFLLRGKAFRIFSGEMHYPRIPREYWKDRLLKARAMGLNTICTYIFWNWHEKEPGKFSFQGNLDVAAFIRTAQEVGLQLMMRPVGPRRNTIGSDLCFFPLNRSVPFFLNLRRAPRSSLSIRSSLENRRRCFATFRPL